MDMEMVALATEAVNTRPDVLADVVRRRNEADTKILEHLRLGGFADCKIQTFGMQYAKSPVVVYGAAYRYGVMVGLADQCEVWTDAEFRGFQAQIEAGLGLALGSTHPYFRTHYFGALS